MKKAARRPDGLPAEVIVHPKLVVTRESGATIAKQIRAGKAAKALRDLMLESGPSGTPTARNDRKI
jgi:hypothetical protein